MADDDLDAREWGTALVVESNEEATVAAGFLKSNGIPAAVESLHVEELPVNLGGLGEVRVRVPHGPLEEALPPLRAPATNRRVAPPPPHPRRGRPRGGGRRPPRRGRGGRGGAAGGGAGGGGAAPRAWAGWGGPGARPRRRPTTPPAGAPCPGTSSRETS